MNIVVRTYGRGRICCRPDTSWERENKDLYVPDSVSGWHWSPILFARICKAGKCVAGKFAARYYDAIGYGMLLYASDCLDGKPDSLAAASCLDHTSILPFPLYNPVTLEPGDNLYRVCADGQEIFSTCEGSQETIASALSQASQYVSLRIGDFLAMELRAPEPLRLGGSENGTEILGTFCDNETFRFRIIK